MVSRRVSLLYSEGHKEEWGRKDREGLSAFLNEDFEYTWKGYAVWDEGNGTVDCHYEAEIVLKPAGDIIEDDVLAGMLERNPFVSKEEIHRHFEKGLREYLDYQFEEYCSEDDYYQPVVEDFDVEYHVTEWSKANRFEVVSCDGDGDDDGYEPKFRRGWY